jgi:uncharacterized protein (DUF2384 family)
MSAATTESEMETTIGSSSPEAATVSSGDVEQIAKARLRSYRALVDRTADVFGDEIKASLWLSTPNPDFQGKPPIQAAQEVDFSDPALERLFEPVFVRIEEGIYW